jgi:Tfp pilus assembly protein PilX
MRNTHTYSSYQRGAALFMSLIFLLIMTILGVFGMNISRMENLMAGNNQFQFQALNDSELALREIEVITLGITEDGAPGVPNFDADDQYHYAGDIDSSALDWSSVDHGTTTNGSDYVVEYEPTVWSGNSAKWNGNGLTASLFTITTQTTSSKGARRTTQVVYGTNEAP